LHDRPVGTHRKTKLGEASERLGVRLPAHLRGVTDGIGEEPQLARGGDARVELAYRARGGVTRIDVFLLAELALARVERVELLAKHQHLATHLELPFVGNSERDRAN